MAHFIDISQPISSGMVVYPGNPAVEMQRQREAKAGQTALTRLTLGSHTGTHIDAVSHVQAGAAGTGAYGLEQMVGEAQVVEVEVREVISATDLPATSSERVLIKTRNSGQSQDVFDPTFVALDESAAEELVKRGVRLLGVDGPSVKKRGVQDRVHEILLEAGVIVLEGLRLTSVSPGTYELLCLPLPVDLDGAPVRAVLR